MVKKLLFISILVIVIGGIFLFLKFNSRSSPVTIIKQSHVVELERTEFGQIKKNIIFESPKGNAVTLSVQKYKPLRDSAFGSEKDALKADPSETTVAYASSLYRDSYYTKAPWKRSPAHAIAIFNKDLSRYQEVDLGADDNILRTVYWSGKGILASTYSRNSLQAKLWFIDLEGGSAFPRYISESKFDKATYKELTSEEQGSFIPSPFINGVGIIPRCVTLVGSQCFAYEFNVVDVLSGTIAKQVLLFNSHDQKDFAIGFDIDNAYLIINASQEELSKGKMMSQEAQVFQIPLSL
ncbi:MAG: hypothetical protein K0S38_680 [Candidatus Paceibacter sp.]|jgi:hypothetical protein|nr:hypothetical protein [Candidatus Paceibacter sp.]